MLDRARHTPLSLSFLSVSLSLSLPLSSLAVAIKELSTHLDPPLGLTKEETTTKNLSLAPRFFPEWVVMATGYSNCFQYSGALAILTSFSASASMYAQTYGHQNWCQHGGAEWKFTPGTLWGTQNLS